MRDDGEVKYQNNPQHHSPRPLPNDWRQFRPTLVFAGHYLNALFVLLLLNTHVHTVLKIHAWNLSQLKNFADSVLLAHRL
jgi:hypothetical protein